MIYWYIDIDILLLNITIWLCKIFGERLTLNSINALQYYWTVSLFLVRTYIQNVDISYHRVDHASYIWKCTALGPSHKTQGYWPPVSLHWEYPLKITDIQWYCRLKRSCENWEPNNTNINSRNKSIQTIWHGACKKKNMFAYCLSFQSNLIASTITVSLKIYSILSYSGSLVQNSYNLPNESIKVRLTTSE